MDAKDREQAFMSALVTEHFALQGFASSTISEGSSRSSIYLLSVSTSLVALGFTTANPDVFGPMAAAVLPTLFVLGWFTIVRLTDLSVENLRCLRQISAIRQHYATLTEQAATFFPTEGSETGDAQRMIGARSRSRRLILFFTMASMIGTVNSVLGGAGLALLLYLGIGVPRTWAVLAGALLAVLLVAAAVLYQRLRFDEAFSEPRS